MPLELLMLRLSIFFRNLASIHSQDWFTLGADQKITLVLLWVRNLTIHEQRRGAWVLAIRSLPYWFTIESEVL